MKRDMELVRLLMLRIEAGDQSVEAHLDSLIHQFPEDIVTAHAALLIEAGFIDGTIIRNEIGVPSGVRMQGLTWEGHNFIDSIRNDSIWAEVKKQVAKAGGSVAMSVISEIAVAVTRQHLGL